MRYDLRYTLDGLKIEPHFCRDYHCDDSHGWTWEEAKEEVLNDIRANLERMSKMTEDDYFN